MAARARAWKLATLVASGAAVFLALHPLRKITPSAAQTSVARAGLRRPGGVFAAEAAPIRAGAQVEELVDHLRAAKTANAMCQAAQELGGTGSEAALDALADTLARGGSWARQCAAQALLRIGGAPARTQLERLLTDHDPRVRQIALDAVAAGDDPDARATVLALARSAGDLELRTDALAALGRAHRSEAVPLMLAQLPRADGPTQRRLIEILGEAGDRAAVPALAQIVRTGGSAGVRQTALSALGQLGGPDALKALQEVLLGGRRDEIGAAAYALANTSDESAHKLLLGVAQSARP